MPHYTQKQHKDAYKAFSAAIKLSFGNESLSEKIRIVNINCYQLLFGSSTIRQRDLSSEQLDRLTQHRLTMIDVIQMSKR